MGVLGAANIARKVVIPSILRASGVDFVAIGSESERGAEFIAERALEGVRACSYDELLDDPEVDAVYVPLPNHLHAEWSKKAADAGKHVLCEKPAARTRAEAAEMIEHCVSRGVVWMEAFMYRFHPQWAQIFERLKGALYDVGYYCVNAARWTIGREPVAAAGRMHSSAEGVDEEFQGILDFGDGRSALIASSFCQPYRHEVELLGTEGRILVPAAFVNGSDPLWFEIENAQGERERVVTPGDDEYRLEVEDFAACVREGRQPEIVSHDDTLANMAAIDALYESARSGRLVELA
jgi:predicted dehydrogenase